jgi:hypothetical protein
VLPSQVFPHGVRGVTDGVAVARVHDDGESRKEGTVTTIVRWTPFRELDNMQRWMRRMLEEVGFAPALLPAADVYETTDEFVIELEVPGYEEKELGIAVSNHTVAVTGTRVESKDESAKTFRLRERDIVIDDLPRPRRKLDLEREGEARPGQPPDGVLQYEPVDSMPTRLTR